jgi:uncharacterized protein (TIGR02246 family)
MQHDPKLVGDAETFLDCSSDRELVVTTLSDKMSRMRNLRNACVLIPICFTAMLYGQAPSLSGNSGAVRDVIDQYMRARNTKDTDAIRRLFTPDADQLVSTGEWRKGLSNLIRGTSASSQKEMGRSSIDVENIRFIDPEVAIVDGRYQTTALNGTVRKMWTTVIVKRTEGVWRITAIRNMLPALPGAAR